ncbi:UDP-2,4-diacetamido-2,4,6-trideoxy-beta-L-altropyranose hydrolase [Pseudodesulfovibrio sp.]|uniref:UDP-2,4-diacetamido-2,4, 6-trideoxy-beta-L-altropyranose hydrolase n=1 Tax=unclassified Pseudodesulfovibrio TaxID=2661612 RepID=UPI003B00947E
MSRTLTIRADASPSMGAGHVMRMIALGQAWLDQGGSVRFVGNVDQLASRLTDEGFAITPVPAVHPDPTDIETLLSSTSPGDRVVLDGYHFDTAYQRAVRKAGRYTLVMDDVADRGEYCTDLLLNQNSDAEQYDYRINSDAVRLLGLRHLLLRREFLDQSPKKEIREQAHNLLVTLGGGDPGELLPKIVSALAEVNNPALNVRIVTGCISPSSESLQKAASALPGKCEILANVKDMPALMTWADLALCGAGSTCWELAFLGVPMLAFVIADNQRGIARELMRQNLAIVLEADTTSPQIAAQITSLAENSHTRQTLCDGGRDLIDGRGSQRVVNALNNIALRLRPATMDDSPLLLKWRNAPEVRAQSFTTDVIDPVSHELWFAKRLESSDCLLLIAEDENGIPVGQIRFDHHEGNAVVSLSVAPDLPGRGIGTAMTRRACIVMAKKWPGVKALALVKRDNQASAQMFRKAGFSKMASTNDHLQFQWDGSNDK